MLRQLKPKHIILAHWENFFKPVKKLERNPRSAPLTNVNQFTIELDTFLLNNPLVAPNGYTLPNINTHIQVEY